MSKKIPRSSEDDYSPEILRQRQAFIEENTPARLHHTRQFSFEPEVMAGNIKGNVLFGFPSNGFRKILLTLGWQRYFLHDCRMA